MVSEQRDRGNVSRHMKTPRFTIITVCYNAEKDISPTMQSVLEQRCQDYEYIVKDGGSTDGTLEQIQKTLREYGRDSASKLDDAPNEGYNQYRVISAPDHGIYDAMNQAIEEARGQYLYFLNAGDVLADADVLGRVSEFIESHSVGDSRSLQEGHSPLENHGSTNEIDAMSISTSANLPAAVYGDIYLIDENDAKDYSLGGNSINSGSINKTSPTKTLRKYTQVCARKSYFLSGDCICHQAIFARRDLSADKKFDTSYQVCADKEWQLYQLTQGKKFLAMNFPVADVLVQGFSSAHAKELEEETGRCVRKYMPRVAWVYGVVNGMKHNRVSVAVLRLLGKTIFTKSK